MTYAASGVDLQAADRVVELIAHDARRTFGPRVLGSPGGFAGCFRLDYNELRFSNATTKTRSWSVAPMAWAPRSSWLRNSKVYDTVGQDLVAMSINDLDRPGRRSALFLDYLAVNKKVPEVCAAM